MIVFRNIFKNPFKNSEQSNKNFLTVRMLNSYSPYILAENNNIYDNLLIRACIDTIAKHGAKLSAKVISKNSSYKTRLQYLLSNRPNKYMSSYDFMYKLISMYFTNNNAFVYINYDYNLFIEGLYPIPYSEIEFLEYENELYCKFYFKSGASSVILPYSELIHLRRHYNENDLAGSPQDVILKPVLTLFKSFIEGFVNSVRATSVLRGYLKYAGNLNPKDLKSYKEQFVNSYMKLDNSDGIAAVDAKCDFIPTKIEPYTVDSRNQIIANNQIYIYYGVSEEILKSKYNEEQFNAFYNSTIEPIAIQFSDEFTNKLFEEKDILQGKKIVFSSARLTFANNSTKASICKEMLQLGIFTFNECREIFEREPVKDGDKRIVSLNYVDASKANEYQGVSEDNKQDKGTSNDKENEQS